VTARAPLPGSASDADARAARRRIARSLHPDMGGDTAAYLTALAALERQHDSTRPTGLRPPLRGLRPGTRRRLRRAVRRLQHRLPRHLPGARRWAEL
jgi:hypothetical protein